MSGSNKRLTDGLQERKKIKIQNVKQMKTKSEEEQGKINNIETQRNELKTSTRKKNEYSKDIGDKWQCWSRSK